MYICGVCVVPYIVYTYSRAQETEAAGAAAQVEFQRRGGEGAVRRSSPGIVWPTKCRHMRERRRAERERVSKSAQRRESEAQQNKNSCRATAVLTASRYSFILLAVRFVSRMREMRSCHQTATDAPSNFCIFNAKGFA